MARTSLDEIMSGAVQPARLYSIAECRMSRHILDALAVDPDFAPVANALEVFRPP